MDELCRAEHGSEARNSYSLRYSNCMLQTKFHIYCCNGDTMWICSFLFNWYNLLLSHQSYFKTSKKVLQLFYYQAIYLLDIIFIMKLVKQ